MRLLNINTYSFREIYGENIPPYIITSHRWSDDETTYKDVTKKRNTQDKGWRKIEGFCERASRDNELLQTFENATCCEWIWIDTCCIDKRSSAEVSESINSMFQWYSQAQECHAYMADVRPFPASQESAEVLDDFNQSEWFKRGWTLQELLAPRCVIFFTKAWEVIGHKCSQCNATQSCEGAGPLLNSIIADVTGIPEDVLRDYERSRSLGVEEKMKWQLGRRTTRVEDRAYCLLGLFDVHMPLLYGEGEKAMLRLERTVFDELQRPWRSHLSLSFTGSATTDAKLSQCAGVRRLGRPLAIMRLSDVEGQVSCVCGYDDDDGWTVACDVCQTWQHQLCYFPEYIDRDLPTESEHRCVKCHPRAVDALGARIRQRAKRGKGTGSSFGRKAQITSGPSNGSGLKRKVSDGGSPPPARHHESNRRQTETSIPDESQTHEGASPARPNLANQSNTTPLFQLESPDFELDTMPMADYSFGFYNPEEFLIDTTDTLPFTQYGVLDAAAVPQMKKPMAWGTHDLPDAQPSDAGVMNQSQPDDCLSLAPYASNADPVLVQAFPLHAITPHEAHDNHAAASPAPSRRIQSYQPYAALGSQRRATTLDSASVFEQHEQDSSSSGDPNTGLCPISTCGRHVKDLKAHMLTHETERPHKCPFPTCDYHTKGFARKYDQNRHTLTHYKGTMVCEFCPGNAAQKSFERADVFKRHLTSMHGVEQTPPNARRTISAANDRKGVAGEVSGKCSICGTTFANAQDFYEHLDDCVLRTVQDQNEVVSFTCAYPACASSGVSFAHRSELQRHVATVHESREQLQLFDCPHPDCERKGDKGFTRKDKMLEHQRKTHETDIHRRTSKRSR